MTKPILTDIERPHPEQWTRRMHAFPSVPLHFISLPIDERNWVYQMFCENLRLIINKRFAVFRMTLKEWADKQGYNVLKVKGRRALVDKIPSEWFAPQWVDLPEEIILWEENL